MSKDELSIRMKEFYEVRTRTYLPRRTYTIIRLDGKAFHTYTKHLDKPFDFGFIDDINETAKYLCENIQGVKLAYVQSDEITLVLTDFDTLSTDAWFNGEVQKIASVSASLASARFNQLRMCRLQSFDIKLAFFDSRCFTIPSQQEVFNNLIWRQRDCIRNSISSVAQALYSHKELEHKNQDDMKRMCADKGFDWNDFGEDVKYGRILIRVRYTKNEVTRQEWRIGFAPLFCSTGLGFIIPSNDC